MHLEAGNLMTSSVHFDNCFVDYTGHSATFALALMQADSQLIVLSHQHCIVKDLRIVPTFSMTYGDARISMPNIAQGWQNKWLGLWRLVYANAIYFQEVYRLRSSWHPSDGESTVVTIANAESRCIFAIALLAVLYPQHRFVLYFQRSAQQIFRVVGLLMRICRIKNMWYIAETAEMAAEWTAVMGIACKTFPFPVSPSTPLPTASCSPAILTFGILGPPRHEKGFDLVLQAYQKLVAAGWGDRTRWIIQVAPVWKESDVDSVVQAFKSSVDPQLHLLTHPLNHDEYSDLWTQIDVIILPYRQSAYNLRSSGVVIEAIANGKPVVVSTGTLLFKVAQAYGAVVEIVSEDADGVTAALYKAVLDFEHLSETAIAAAHQWRWQFSPAAFLQFIRSDH